MRKTCAERRKLTLLKDVKIRKRFYEKVIESVVMLERQIYKDI